MDLDLLSLFPQKGARIMGEKGSKLKEVNNGGKNLHKTDVEKGGRRPPFIGPHESNRWQPTNHGTTGQRAVLPLKRYYRTLKCCTTALRQRFCGSSCGSSHGTT